MESRGIVGVQQRIRDIIQMMQSSGQLPGNYGSSANRSHGSRGGSGEGISLRNGPESKFMGGNNISPLPGREGTFLRSSSIRRAPLMRGKVSSYNSSFNSNNKGGLNGGKGAISSKFMQMVQTEARRQGVSPRLVEAVIQTESGGETAARSPAGALGLMQLMPATAKSLGVNPLIAEENIAGGIQYLKQMAHRFGSLDLTLAAYNAGPKAVEKYGGVPPYNETQNYIRKIRKLLNSPTGQ